MAVATDWDGCLMKITTMRDLSATVRGRRQDLGLSPAELASMAQVSREWVSSVESGKATVEVGLVIRLLDALGLVLDLVTDDPATDEPLVDLDALLGALRDR